MSNRFSIKRSFSNFVRRVTSSINTTVPTPPPRRHVSPAAQLFPNFRPQDAQRIIRRQRFGLGSSPETALSQLRNNPGDFMRKHYVRIQGQRSQRSGPMEMMMIDEGPIAKRRSSVDGSDVAVHQYQILPSTAYEGWRRGNVRGEHRITRFHAEHVAMEASSMGDATTAPQRRRDDGTSTSVEIMPGRQRDLITHAVSGCSIVRRNSGVSHWWPNGRRGATLEQNIRTHNPDADVFGPSRYMDRIDMPATNTPVNLFMQQSRRGSIDIYSQDRPRIDANGYWSANVNHTHMASNTTGRIHDHRRNQLHNQLGHAVAARQMRQQLAEQRNRLGGYTPPVNNDVADHEWD